MKNYNKNWKETHIKSYNETLKSNAFEKYFEYDNKNRLFKYQSISGQGSGSKCPDEGNYINEYNYNDNGFINNINHTYKQYTCEMTFEYQK